MAYEIVTAKYVEDHIGDMSLVDVRPRYKYRDGHIPTAQNVDLIGIKDEFDDVADKLEEGFEALGIKPDDDVIIYCGTGKLAKEASDYLDEKGYKHIHMYPGSFVDWTSDPSRPVEK